MAQTPSRFPVDEGERLQALHQYRLLDTAREPAFDRITKLAAWIFRTPIALISLVDFDRQWFKSAFGLEVQQTPRAVAFCSHAIREVDVLVVPDARRDPRFTANPLVTGDPRIRFYAGAPIRTPDGFALGTLSIIDRVPRDLDSEGIEKLADLAALAADEMELQLALTRTREAQAQALESLALFQVMAEEAAVGVYMIQDNRFQFVNRAMSEMFGFTAEEFRAMDPLEIVDKTSKAAVADQIDRRMSGASPRSRHRFTGITAKDDIRIFEVDGGRTTVRGRPAVIGTLRDVTDEARAEQWLLDAEQRYRAIVETASDAIITIDADSVILFANPAAERMFGHESGTMTGQSLLSVIPQRLRGPHKHGVEQFCRSRSPTISWRNVEFPALHRDGTEIPLELSFAHFLENGNDRFVAIARDMRGRRALERQLEHERRISGLGRLAATVAHEFNNVLMGIQTAGELLSKRPSAADEQRAVAMIQRSIARGKRVTSDILLYGSAQQPALSAIDLAQWLRELSDDVNAVFSDEVVVEINTPPEAVWTTADTSQLTQVLLNLASNARDAMTDSGTFRISLRRSGAESPFATAVEDVTRFCCLIVEDSGGGVPAEILTSIFEPFFTTKHRSGGTGLGLALVHKVINQHHGSIFVESSIGRGTAFHIFLPRSGAIANSPPLPRPPASIKPRRLLIVEDDDIVATGLVAAFVEAGIACERVSQGNHAVEGVRRFEPDAVVLDVGLPDISGLEVLRRLRLEWPTLPVILSTGVDVTSPAAAADSNVAVLLKPYSTDELLASYARLVER